MDSFVRDVTSNLYGNPHSESTSSRLSTLKIEEVRLRALQFFNASPDDFDLVFVQNATAAIKLVTEIIQSHSEKEGGFWYAYHGDAHTSLVGIREVAKAGYACFSRDEDVENWIHSEAYHNDEKGTHGRTAPTRLFAYPGQSNMTGRRLPLSWPGRIRRSALNDQAGTYTLLDAAALASTAELDLSNADEAPDFVALSFYKIFGYPDLGALLVRRELAPMLNRRRYFGGGTVEMVLNGLQWHSLHAEHPHEYLEDGTLPFHNIVALGHALTAHERIYTSQKHVSRHTARLTKYLYESMASLFHADGTPLCVIYKESGMAYGDPSTAGSTIAFNLRYADGSWVKLDDLEVLAKEASIHLRTGGVCNPGGIAKSLDLAPWEFLRNYVAGTRCGHGPVVLGGKPAGIARVSLGAMSNKRDVDVFIAFLRGKFRNVLPEGGDALEWTAGMGLRVEGLTIYPIEGAGGWRVSGNSAWPVEEAGLKWDRAWFVVDLDSKEILTREAAPRLLLLSSEVYFEDGILRVTPHKSLGDTMSVGNRHICLPLREDPSWALQQAVCGACAVAGLQMSTQTVRRGAASVIAQACLSDHVVSFFSSALGTRCTVARVTDLASRTDIAVQAGSSVPTTTILVNESSPPPSPTVEDPQSSGTLVSAGRTSSSLDSDSPRSLGEALLESMQANVILARDVAPGVSTGEADWLFLTIRGLPDKVRRLSLPFPVFSSSL